MFRRRSKPQLCDKPVAVPKFRSEMVLRVEQRFRRASRFYVI
jgi:hypothetical protein